MDILQAPAPSKRRGLTASQWLYQEFLEARQNRRRTQMQAAKWGLISICKVACGLLRPHRTDYGQSRPLGYFYTDAWRDRRHFAEQFVTKELNRGMTMVEARHMGRKCKLRLIDEVRRQTGFNKVREQRDFAFLKALQTTQHLNLQDDLWKHIQGCQNRSDATNTAIAEAWGKSEGWIRKLRKRLASRLWIITKNDGERHALSVLRLRPD